MTRESAPPEFGFASVDQALAYLREHDRQVKELYRKTMPKLREIKAEVLRVKRITELEGGDPGKDELVASILELRFPHASAARAFLYDRPQEG